MTVGSLWATKFRITNQVEHEVHGYNMISGGQSWMPPNVTSLPIMFFCVVYSGSRYRLRNSLLDLKAGGDVVE